MKRIILSSIFLFLSTTILISQEIAPYIKVGESTNGIEAVANQVRNALTTNSFSILGEYTPASNSKLKVITFTNDALKNTVVKVKDRGALASIFKVGLNEKDGKTVVSYTNPEYILRAYLNKNYESNKNTYQQFSIDVKSALKEIGNEFASFGGGIKADKLGKYHYKIMMPYFSDPITLNEFSSFEEGLKTIQKNLSQQKGNTQQVYTLVYPEQQVAVFGIGLLNKEKGEANFLPKIGDDHVAALPYELILQGNTATMLHGRYRIALHWPDLTMGTFMKIMSTPGDIKDTFQTICE